MPDINKYLPAIRFATDAKLQAQLKHADKAVADGSKLNWGSFRAAILEEMGRRVAGDLMSGPVSSSDDLASEYEPETNEGPFICKATGCGYFDGPEVPFGQEPDYCPKHSVKSSNGGAR